MRKIAADKNYKILKKAFGPKGDVWIMTHRPGGSAFDERQFGILGNKEQAMKIYEDLRRHIRESGEVFVLLFQDAYRLEFNINGDEYTIKKADLIDIDYIKSWVKAPVSIASGEPEPDVNEILRKNPWRDDQPWVENAQRHPDLPG